MNVSSFPAGAPSGPVSARPNSFTDAMTARSAEVARRSCSSAPLIPDVGMRRAACQDCSVMVQLQMIRTCAFLTRYRDSCEFPPNGAARLALGLGLANCRGFTKQICHETGGTHAYSH